MLVRTHVARVQRDDAVVLSPIGEFDLATVDDLRQELHRALEDTNRVVLDLADTRFLDSISLGVMVAACRRAKAAGGWLRLVRPRPNVRRMLRITQLDAVFDVYKRVDEAVERVEVTAPAADPTPAH